MSKSKYDILKAQSAKLKYNKTQNQKTHNDQNTSYKPGPGVHKMTSSSEARI